MLMRFLALVFNAFPVRWQRRFMTAAHDRFLVGVAGLGVDGRGRVLLARHRFGGPQWRFLGGFIRRGEPVEDALTAEVAEIRWFPRDALPDVRADQRGLIERHLDRATDWGRTIRADDLRRGPP